MAPIGFLSDHLEVLYDVDIAFKRLAESKQMQLERIAMLNASPALIDILAAVLRNIRLLSSRRLLMAGSPKHVVVVGAGIAGLAARACAEHARQDGRRSADLYGDGVDGPLRRKNSDPSSRRLGHRGGSRFVSFTKTLGPESVP